MRRLLLLGILVVLGGLLLATCAVSAEPPRAPLAIHRVEPNTAPLSGGTAITIIGLNFDTTDVSAPLEVLVNNVPCGEVTVRSASMATAVLPGSRSRGAVDVEVRSGTQRALLRDALYYDDGRGWGAWRYRLRARIGATWTIIKQGGTVMAILAPLSIFAVAWAIHCALVIRAGQLMPPALLDQLSGHISRGEIDAAVDLCQRDGSMFARVAMATLRRAGQSHEKIREVAEAVGSRETLRLMQRISYLSNVAVISPMLGLLGTVFGMIMAFNALEIGEATAKQMQLAGALNKAMVTTAAGLIVGIPAMAFYYFFKGRLLRIVAEVEQVSEEMTEAISAARSGTGAEV